MILTFIEKRIQHLGAFTVHVTQIKCQVFLPIFRSVILPTHAPGASAGVAFGRESRLGA